MDSIRRVYSKIPDSGLYTQHNNKKEFYKLFNKFKVFCSYLMDSTKDDQQYKLMYDISQIEHTIETQSPEWKTLKQLLLNTNVKRTKFRHIKKKMKKLKKYPEVQKLYKTILQKYNLTPLYKEQKEHNQLTGTKSRTIGSTFEETSFPQILPIIASTLNIPINKLTLLKNVDIYLNDQHISEIDAIIVKDNQLIAVAEIKRNFDDIGHAHHQLTRTFKTLAKNYTIKNHQITTKQPIKNPIKKSFIITQFDPTTTYYNVTSRINRELLARLWKMNTANCNNELKFFFYYFKQKTLNQLNTTQTIKHYEDNNVIDNIILLTDN